MAKKIVNRGLQMIGDRASGVSGAGAAIASMSIDDSTVAFAAGDTALNTGGAVSNEADADLDSTPTRSGQTVSHIATFDTSVFNGNTIKRIALHNAAAASVSSSSATLIAGVDAQSLLKDASFTLTITLKITYTST